MADLAMEAGMDDLGGEEVAMRDLGMRDREGQAKARDLDKNRLRTIPDLGEEVSTGPSTSGPCGSRDVLSMATFLATRVLEQTDSAES